LDCISTIAERDNERKFFGISCYNVVLQYLDKLLIEGNSVHKDLRIFTFICDHKKLLKMRCEFLKSERLCDLSNEDMECFDELCKWAEMLLNLFMKYMVSKKRDLLVKMKMILMQMKRKEKHALEKLTKMLDQERTEEQNEM